MIIHGGAVSPFVRKTHAFFLEKGVAFETSDLSPIPKTEELLAISPLGKIPVLEDGGHFIPDSSVICHYVERVHPSPALYPEDPVAFARALFLEEFADTRGAEVLSPALFERVIKKRFFDQDADEARLETVRTEAAPPVFDQLEKWIESEDAAVGHFSIADCALGAQLQNWALAGENLDAARWPKLSAYAERVLARPSFAKLSSLVGAS